MKLLNRLRHDLFVRPKEWDRVRKNNARVLVASYTYDGKAYALKPFFSALKKLDYSNWEFLMVENSGNNDFQKVIETHLKELPVKSALFSTPRLKNSRARIQRSQEKIWEYFTKSGINGKPFDYLFLIEADIIVPASALLDLLSQTTADRKLIGGLYSLENQDNEYNDVICVAPVVFHLGETGWSAKMMYEQQLRKLMVGPEKMQPYPLFLVLALGFGCTLMHKSVVDQTWPRIDPKRNLHSDSYFYQDCLWKKIKVYLYPYLRRDLFGNALPLIHHRSRWSDVKDQ